jgi:hypothetical protein
MADASLTSALLRGAGFDAVRTEAVPVRIVLADVDAYIALIADTAGPIGLTLQRLSDAERRPVRTAVQAACERFVHPDGYALSALALCAVGTA